MMSSEINAQTPSVERRILRLPQVEQKTGFKRAHIYELMKKGEFPQKVPIGVRAVGWDSAEVEQWVDDRRRKRI